MSPLTAKERSIVILEHVEGTPIEEIARRRCLSIEKVNRILRNVTPKFSKKDYIRADRPQNEPKRRRLIYWLEGPINSVEDPNILHLMRHITAQTICLAIAKRPKSIWQIACETCLQPEHVEQIIQGLLEAEAIVTRSKGRYLLNFIAFEAQDWLQLSRYIIEPAEAAAVLLAKSETRLKATFANTTLAACGWCWKDFIWLLYAGLVSLVARIRNSATAYDPNSYPERPDGYSYFLGAYELADGTTPLWNTGCHGYMTEQGLSLACFWSPLKSQDKIKLGRKPTETLEKIVSCKPTLEDAYSNLGLEAEIIDDLLEKGFIKEKRNKLLPTIPIITGTDSELLTDEVDRAILPVIKHVLNPASSRLKGIFDSLGYVRLGDQYSLWHNWFAARIMGEALRHLMQQGMLPYIEEPFPPSFAFLAWEPKLPLMNLRSV